MNPRYSIIIPFYNGLSYIEQCVSSILSQDFESLEIIIVDDCDPDNSGAELDALFENENRIKIIHHEENRGTLQTRCDGVLSSTGKYVMLMDQDDTLASGALYALEDELNRESTDILHFGVQVIAENASAKEASQGMQGFLTPPVRSLFGKDILKYQFASQDGFDWQVNHKVYNAKFARKAWDMMGDIRLSRADDVYASFVIATFASSYRAVEGAWYEYHLGRGDTFGSIYVLDEFKRWCDADAQAYTSVSAFIESHGLDFAGTLCSEEPQSEEPQPEFQAESQSEVQPEFQGESQLELLQPDLRHSDLQEGLNNVRDLMIQHTMNELVDNLDENEHASALKYVQQFWPADVIAGELWRFVRDRSYALLEGETLNPDDALFRFVDEAKRFDLMVEGAGTERYQAMREVAVDYVTRLESTLDPVEANGATVIRALEYEKQPIRIFVTTHKDVATFDSNILQPVQVGSATRKRLWWAYQDDAGENIACRNVTYCELTTQYWAWKNIDAQYYGFCHYRRYFDFALDQHDENPWGEVTANRINKVSQTRYGLDDEIMARVIEGWDVITTGIIDVRQFPEHPRNVYDHYCQAPYLKKEHLNRIIEILVEEHPDYADDVILYFEGYKTCFCNMFIMRKELFDRYCAWLFPLLDRFVSEWDTSLLSKEALRTPGHLAERLFNIWLMHEMRFNLGLKHKQLQCVRFKHPEYYRPPVLPAVDGVVDGIAKPVIPLVFAADNNYVPIVTTAVYSLVKNASPDYFYDVVIMESDFTDENKSKMLKFFGRFSNVGLRFARVHGMVDEYDLQTNNEHIGIETYYRFLVQDILPDYKKVLYLDSDLVVNDDISKLFAIDIGDNLIGAVRDADYLGNLNMNDGIRLKYTKELLGMKDPYGYFQAGVLVMNLEEMRKLNSVKQWLEYSLCEDYIYDDQDILNVQCEGRVFYLDSAWNAMNNCMGRIENACSFAPAKVYDEFLAGYANPKIMHFAGCEKPWKPGGCDREEMYWKYARETPFYKQHLTTIFKQMTKQLDELHTEIDRLQQGPIHERAVPEDSNLRKVFDGMLPLGSRRREASKAIGRFVQGKK